MIKILRRLWRIIKPVKTYTFEEMSKLLVNELREKGANIGSNVDIIDTKIDMSTPFLITIGDNVTITNCRILTHDASTKKVLGYTKTGHVTIGSNVFIGADSIILPNTTIGDKVIIGAGTVIAHDIPDNSVVIGNPSRFLCTYDQYMERQKDKLKENPVFDFMGYELNFENKLQERETLKSKKQGFFI